jgi:tetratricopeptide (TPR) repeat protein
MVVVHRRWRSGGRTVLCAAAILFAALVQSCQKELPPAAAITVDYPAQGTLFPPDIVAPTIKWHDEVREAGLWNISIRGNDGAAPLSFTSSSTNWRVPGQAWKTMQERFAGKTAEIVITGAPAGKPKKRLSIGSLSIAFSRDSVVAPIFYREVNLPFEEAVKDPSTIKWRFGSVASEERPHVVLQNLKVCGNCHSFSKDGKTLALEVDSGNDKGAYAIVPVVQDVVLDRTKIVSWASYRADDKEPTFGLLCQISPDGRYVAGTVKDQALAVYRPDLMFSQLFFLIKGIVAIYDRQTKTFTALPGADDRRFVQTNATWSPDCSYLVFSRSMAYNLDVFTRQRRALIGGPEAEAFIAKEGRSYKYDLYRIPFNGGRGGKAEPLEGASNNGMSNYFPKISPDGKWIVFCQARNYMLLQPDSKLCIIPAKGGTPRVLACNTGRLNSWHSWSPNGKWLVFSSKVNGPFTQLFLTHIDDEGNSSPALLLETFAGGDRAANIPEFVNTKPDALVRIRENYLDAYSYYRIANLLHISGEYDKAIPAYRIALEHNPNDYHAHNNLGALLWMKGDREGAVKEFVAANDLRIDDEDHYEAHTNLGAYYFSKGKNEEAVRELSAAFRLHPDSTTKVNLERAKQQAEGTVGEQSNLRYQ